MTRSQMNENVHQCFQVSWNVKLTVEKKKPPETFTERFRELVKIHF